MVKHGVTENQLDAVRYLFLVLIEFWVIVTENV
jgi:hypothetical protein